MKAMGPPCLWRKM